jgi:hypothetical protein
LLKCPVSPLQRVHAQLAHDLQDPETVPAADRTLMHQRTGLAMGIVSPLVPARRVEAAASGGGAGGGSVGGPGVRVSTGVGEAPAPARFVRRASESSTTLLAAQMDQGALPCPVL